MRVLVTRPPEDAESFAADLRARGHDVLFDPMLTIHYLDGPALDLAGVQALLVTSANGARAFARRQADRDLKVMAVGESSAAVARGLGFGAVESAGGDVEALAALVESRLDPARGALLHVAAGTVAGDLAGRLARAGFDYRRAVLYEARPATALGAATADALRSGTVDGVAFFSPRTAKAFAGLAESAGLASTFKGLAAWCLSAAVADAARRLPWRTVRIAAEPSRAALLDAVDAP